MVVFKFIGVSSIKENLTVNASKKACFSPSESLLGSVDGQDEDRTCLCFSLLVNFCKEHHLDTALLDLP